jgi:hypothetical protein
MFFDPVKKVVTKFAIHPYWGQRNTAVVKFEEVRIQYLYPYNPDPKVISEQVTDAGGWENYNGQLMYCSMAGDFVYPAPIYDPVVSDMSTEDAIASVKNRNSRNNFLPAGMLVVKKGKDSGDTETTRDSDDFDENFKSFQGAENACKIIKVEAQFDEERPEFVPFDTKNYDKEFDYSEKSVQENIGKVFMQPAVLRGEMIAGKLGTSTEIKDATDFYNAITEPERIYIEESYAAAFDGFAGRTAEMDYTILPIEYKISDQNAISNPE